MEGKAAQLTGLGYKEDPDSIVTMGEKSRGSVAVESRCREVGRSGGEVERRKGRGAPSGTGLGTNSFKLNYEESNVCLS